MSYSLAVLLFKMGSVHPTARASRLCHAVVGNKSDGFSCHRLAAYSALYRLATG